MNIVVDNTNYKCPSRIKEAGMSLGGMKNVLNGVKNFTKSNYKKIIPITTTLAGGGAGYALGGEDHRLAGTLAGATVGLGAGLGMNSSIAGAIKRNNVKASLSAAKAQQQTTSTAGTAASDFGNSSANSNIPGFDSWNYSDDVTYNLQHIPSGAPSKYKKYRGELPKRVIRSSTQNAQPTAGLKKSSYGDYIKGLLKQDALGVASANRHYTAGTIGGLYLLDRDRR